jgi:hypothetical protein
MPYCDAPKVEICFKFNFQRRLADEGS